MNRQLLNKKLKIYNFLYDDLVSIREVRESSQDHPLYNDACRVIHEIDEIFDKVNRKTDEHVDELMDCLCKFNDLSKENKRFVFDVTNVESKT